MTMPRNGRHCHLTLAEHEMIGRLARFRKIEPVRPPFTSVERTLSAEACSVARAGTEDQ
jgi:hypothetical protein